MELYTALVNQFGPLSKWKTCKRPSDDETINQRYKLLLDDFARKIGASPKAGPQCQINWAASKTIRPQYTLCGWENKVVAKECGFISGKLIPKAREAYRVA